MDIYLHTWECDINEDESRIVFNRLSRVAVPLLKKGVATIAKQALLTGAQLAGDIISGKNATRVVKRPA